MTRLATDSPPIGGREIRTATDLQRIFGGRPDARTA